ncbi:MAG: DUF456 domain-containing protein [Angustibacter sp.]
MNRTGSSPAPRRGRQPLSDVAVWLFGAAFVVGLLGCLLPILPGLLLQLGAFLLWAVLYPSSAAWIGFCIAVALFAVGTTLKFLLPGRKLRAQGIPNSTLWLGSLGAIVGFFVLPVLGLVLGFLLGVFGAEYRRLGTSDAAQSSTKRALVAAGWSTLIEFAAGLAIAVTWLVAVLQ